MGKIKFPTVNLNKGVCIYIPINTGNGTFQIVFEDDPEFVSPQKTQITNIDIVMRKIAHLRNLIRLLQIFSKTRLFNLLPDPKLFPEYTCINSNFSKF